MKQKKYLPTDKLHKHRILPGHQGGTYNPENVIGLTYEDHILAHYYRYLAYSDIGDLKAYTLMTSKKYNDNYEESMRRLCSLAGQLGGKARSEQAKRQKELFFDPKWQKEFGFKGAGQRNVSMGIIQKLNRDITENNPEQRSEAGKLGAKARLEKQKREQTNLFDPKALMQKRGNLVRWGIKINGKRIPYESLSSDFIEYYIAYGTKSEY